MSPNRIVVYGESLGTAVAADLAARRPVGGVVLEEGFTSIVDVGREMFPFLPVRWMARNRYDALTRMSRLNTPVLIIHSLDDEVFSITHGRRLFEAAREPKRFVELRGGHNDAFYTSGAAYRDGLRVFLRDHLGWQLAD